MRELKLTLSLEVDGRPFVGLDPFIRRLMVDETTGMIRSNVAPGDPSDVPASTQVSAPTCIILHALDRPITVYPNDEDTTPFTLNPGGVLVLFDVTLLNGGPRLSNESESAIPVDTFLGGS